ncbi:hypothetical protein [Herbiconiux liukaitaii]|uniref:hypothetical protein n=1 Tax=Herbiconiux liukaitaii TaxID=3342799 RepID=UPI0035BB8567
MTELAYMVREDWAQHGTAMEHQSAIIRNWIGGPPYLFAVTDVTKFNQDDRGADVEAAVFVAPSRADRKVFNIRELKSLERGTNLVDHAIVVLHPFEQRELETIRQTVEANSVGKLFILIRSRYEMVRTWLDGLGAMNLHTGEGAPATDPLLLAAAEMIHNEDYNGLDSGRGKDAVVQLVRAFVAEGYSDEPEAWLRAYFAVGGSFHHAESIEKLTKEIKAGTRHRVKTRYRDDIVNIIREQLAAQR